MHNIFNLYKQITFTCNFLMVLETLYLYLQLVFIVTPAELNQNSKFNAECLQSFIYFFKNLSGFGGNLLPPKFKALGSCLVCLNPLSLPGY